MLDEPDRAGPALLPTPEELRSRLPVGSAASAVVKSGRRSIADVLHGRDPERLVVIAGPCSVHDAEAALEYAHRLARVARETADLLVIAMRTYVEKPRTTMGWKGLVHDPHLDGSCDLGLGLERSRSLLLAINEIGVPCASELIDPMVPFYLADLLSWAAIGARTSESQTHREMASGLDMPVGFKNGTSGAVEIARNAMIAARRPHSVFGLDPTGRASRLRTRGNRAGHLILRGGGGRANYSADDVARAAGLVASEGLARPVMVDCSHDNSGGDPAHQPVVCRAVLEQIREADTSILGVLLESHLRAGRQDWSGTRPLEFGVSITDACMGWEETKALLYEIAEAVAASKAPGRPGRLGPTDLREVRT